MDIIRLWPWMLCPQDKDLVTETAPVLDFRKKTDMQKPARSTSFCHDNGECEQRPQPPLTTSCLFARDEDGFEQKQKMLQLSQLSAVSTTVNRKML